MPLSVLFWRRTTLIGFAGFAVLSLVWGTQFLVIKTGQQYVPPLMGAAFRFALLAAVAQAAMWAMDTRVSKGQRGARVGFAFSQAICMVLLHWGQDHLDSSLAGVLFSTAPLFVALLAGRWVVGERVDRCTVAALSTGFLGIVVITASSMAELGWQDLRLLAMGAVLFAAFANATNKVFSKNLTTRVPAAVLLRDMGLVVAAVAGGSTLFFEDPSSIQWTATAVVSHVYLGVVASALASALFLVLLRRYRVTAMSYLQFVTATVAVVVGIAVAGEDPGATVLVGCAIVLVGLWLLRKGPNTSVKGN